MPYDLIQRNTNASVFENPDNANDQLRITRAVQPKKLGALTVDNVRAEVITTRRIDPRGEDCTDCTLVLENLSVRITSSGSVASALELEKMLDTSYWTMKQNFARLAAGQNLPMSTVVLVNPALTTTVA